MLGVLFTEIPVVTPEVLATLRQKTCDAIDQSAPPELIADLRVRFQAFPETRTPSTHNGDSGSSIHVDSKLQNAGPYRSFLKRTFDVFGSLLALLLFSPVLLVIALAIKATSPGPVLYRQKRIGLRGQPFTFLKFRSMYQNNNSAIHQQYVAALIAGGNNLKQANGTYKLMNDHRITPIGRILRKTSLDELPQFLNVLVGHMSIVGPRPPITYEYEQYLSWHKRRVLDAKPGLTGFWQVNGRSRTTFDEMVRMDLHYARNTSLLMDL
jgi:lipopolysaccharide/colanic/teichoic acid biosynthesis glycosyltransferase